MSIAVLVMTDGRRDCITRTVASFDAMAAGPVSRRIIHDDSSDPRYRRWLAKTFPSYELVATPGRSGFGGAIRSAWRHLDGHTTEPWIFHLEDDFLFNRGVHLPDLVHVLTARPYLAQMALRRQPWNPQEAAAGGIVEQHPDDYHDTTDGTRLWLEHRRFFTTNPCLYRRSLLNVGWPDADQSEGHFGLRLLQQGTPEVPGLRVRFGFWGARSDTPWVEHIGHQRIGVGY